MKFVDELEKIKSINFVDGDLYKAAFGTKAGEQVLSDLIRLYYFPSDVSLADSHQIAYQQGQSEVVHYILRKLTTIGEQTAEDGTIEETNDE